MPRVFWAALLERNTQDHAVESLLEVAMWAGKCGYTRIRWGYSRTDLARNSIVEIFLKESTDPMDVLVMLDNDHTMPPNILDLLTRWDEGVVGALAFRRGPPYFPCAFVRIDGMFHVIKEWEKGLYEVSLVGTGAIAIRRWVFEKLDEAGYSWPYFRYTYPPGEKVLPSEDIYFGDTCEKAGIIHHVDTTFCIPHLAGATVDEESWKQFQVDHPEVLEPGFKWDEFMQLNLNDKAEA